MNYLKILIYLFFISIFFSCETTQKKFTLQGTISNANGKYLKLMDMTSIGFPLDSVVVNSDGSFTYEKQITEPADFVVYIEPQQSVRITPLPAEQISLSANANNLIHSYKVSGSESSVAISKYTKYLQKLKTELNSVNAFYMQNQDNPNIDSIIQTAKKRSDSIFNLGKLYLQKTIKTNPAGMESYVALAQKLTHNINFFTISKDFKYFTMVDTAFARAYDTAKVAIMLHSYVQKQQKQKATQTNSKLQIGNNVPNIILPNAYGDTLSLSELKGKYVLIDFWGSWCRPCRLEHKNLLKTYNKFRRYDFEIFQVALEYNKENWKNAIREDKLWWKYQVSELKYMDSEIAKIYKISKVPYNFLINREGQIIAINIYGKNLQKKLETIFFKPKTTNKQNQL